MRSAMGILALMSCKGNEDSPIDSPPEPTPDAPIIESAEVACHFHDTGDTFHYWTAAVRYSDPQGSDDLPTTGHGFLAERDARAVWESDTALVCVDGACTAYFKADDTGVECDDPTAWTFTITLRDRDGHEARAEVRGIQDF